MHITSLVVSVHFRCTSSHVLQSEQALVWFVVAAKKEFLASISTSEWFLIF